MSADDFSPPPEDPFTDADPEAHERERRRLAREAKRRERSGRASLAKRVGGALDGAAAKGREKIEQGRERVVSPPDPPEEGAAPPPLRRTSTSATPADDPPPATASAPPEQPASPRTVIHSETDEFGASQAVAVTRAADAPPAPESPGVPAGVDSAPPRRPRRTAAAGEIWRRRLLALGVVAVLAIAVVAAVSLLSGNEEPAPAPKGPRTLQTSSVTLPEGFTEAEMAGVAKDAGLKGSYEKAAKKAAGKFDLKQAGAPDGTDTLEGFLFPATYEVEKGAPAGDLIDKQLTEGFDANIAEVDLSYAKNKNLSLYDVVTIASMIEREVQVPEERDLVAAVIYNRLADGETLGIDATLRYEVGFDEPLTESQLAEDTPYNTRINGGLPPTPIGNPGLDSLQAAANPADVDFKYYVFKPGTCGEHTFTADYDEFLALSDEYQAALAAEGGQPSDC